MRVKILFTLFVIACAGAISAQTGNAPSITWSDSTRDVYVDTELDRSAQVLTAESPSRLVLISSKLESAVVINVPEHTVSTTPKESFQFNPDRTSATSDSTT